jgi:hypothetical protein
MRALAGVIFGTAIIFSAEPTWAQTYDPKYPVCMEVNAGEDSHIECWFTSMEQCKNGSTGTGHCFENPYYKPPPPEPEPVAETAPVPAAKTKKTKK